MQIAFARSPYQTRVFCPSQNRKPKVDCCVRKPNFSKWSWAEFLSNCQNESLNQVAQLVTFGLSSIFKNILYNLEKMYNLSSEPRLAPAFVNVETNPQEIASNLFLVHSLNESHVYPWENFSLFWPCRYFHRSCWESLKTFTSFPISFISIAHTFRKLKLLFGLKKNKTQQGLVHSSIRRGVLYLKNRMIAP